MSSITSSPSASLYIRNLSTRAGAQRTRANLYLLFATYGEVLSVAINFRRQRGQAFVTMRSDDEANLARIALQGQPFMGSELDVQFAHEPTKSL
ncbi:U2 snRNP complex subunit [Maudiozyma humilis]|uniref:U2 snRNP complex subunit n=1 Tax=Maudiozyma humilis TaxID=51915 RepID=A0AAV5RWF4_MAUHU|nr:U2 snRNP complex subunit [Kazachstania humilis]